MSEEISGFNSGRVILEPEHSAIAILMIGAISMIALSLVVFGRDRHERFAIFAIGIIAIGCLLAMVWLGILR
ncbi:MAG: hypothetical protein WDN46_22490 [Methylocella sp.]